VSIQGSTEKFARQTAKESAPTDDVAVALSALSFGKSPRLVPEDLDHARVLAEVDHLPPIMVHAETMMVIDGRHRVLAARLRGENSIRARLFQGTEDEAFLLGVRANTTHGKPLSLAERLQAVSQILSTKPDLSDRAIAGICGLSPHTVANRRRAGPTSDVAQRVGTDGRTRPLNTTTGRRQAAALMLAFPDDSNRKIAREVGLSEATVRDVRLEIKRAAGISTETSDNPVVNCLDGKPRPDEPIPRKIATSLARLADCAQCASWLVAHSISGTSRADLLHDISLSKRPPAIVEALVNSERKSASLQGQSDKECCSPA
jgi:ParB-like chromosome segregation protein Spo0J